MRASSILSPVWTMSLGLMLLGSPTSFGSDASTRHAVPASIHRVQLPDNPYCCLGLFNPNPPSGPLYCALSCDSPGRNCHNKIGDVDLRYSIDTYSTFEAVGTRAVAVGCSEANTITVK